MGWADRFVLLLAVADENGWNATAEVLVCDDTVVDGWLKNEFGLFVDGADNKNESALLLFRGAGNAAEAWFSVIGIVLFTLLVVVQYYPTLNL